VRRPTHAQLSALVTNAADAAVAPPADVLQVRTTLMSQTPTAPRSLIPTGAGNTVRSFHYARTTVRSPRKLNHGLTL
jgi:hypothetical protein